MANQAAVLHARGDLDGAMAFFKESERIFRELGFKEGLARSLANQAIISTDMDRLTEAIHLFEEAYRIVKNHNLAALISEIEQMMNPLVLKKIRRRIEGVSYLKVVPKSPLYVLK